MKKKCGFAGILARSGPRTSANFSPITKKADEAVWAVTFSLGERLVLVPVEISLAWKLFALVTLAIFFLSGIEPEIFAAGRLARRD